jgi:quinol monooxygenase YgiN
MIHVIATIELEKGCRDHFLGILKENIPQVLTEKGCRSYAPAVDADSGLPGQAALREDVVTIIEAWDSLDHLRAHLKAPHMLSYRNKVQGMVRNVGLQVLASA